MCAERGGSVIVLREGHCEVRGREREGQKRAEGQRRVEEQKRVEGQRRVRVGGQGTNIVGGQWDGEQNGTQNRECMRRDDSGMTVGRLRG